MVESVFKPRPVLLKECSSPVGAPRAETEQLILASSQDSTQVTEVKTLNEYLSEIPSRQGIGTGRNHQELTAKVPKRQSMSAYGVINAFLFAN